MGDGERSACFCCALLPLAPKCFSGFLNQYLLVILSKILCATSGHPRTYLLPNSNRVDSRLSDLKNITEDMRLSYQHYSTNTQYINLCVRSHFSWKPWQRAFPKGALSLSSVPAHHGVVWAFIPCSPWPLTLQNPLWHSLYLNPAS